MGGWCGKEETISGITGMPKMNLQQDQKESNEKCIPDGHSNPDEL